jgi:two-component system cell cycle sensor histidine kinase/response regulator CckA
VLTTLTAIVVTRFTWPVFAGAPFAPLFAAVAATTHWGSGSAGLVAVALGTLGAELAFPTTGQVPWSPYTLFGFVPVALIGNRLIAGRNRAVAALRASEAQLRATWQQTMRAHKMEAVGQLVAGVAHNFNNLLTVTMGYTDILQEQHQHAGLDQTAVQEIRRATERGAALTRQLLAFGRKHDVRLARIDLDRTIEGLREMLTRMIREDIELTIHVERGPLAVLIDPLDLEQVIVNLVINARDALPAGGTIHVDVGRERIDAANTSLDPSMAPGEYVRLRVRDNGIGMAPDVQSRVFEPFFTTKEVGEGTGLGLAFVHGIARHAGGFAAIETAPSKGTTVSVYLPPAPEVGALLIESRS